MSPKQKKIAAKAPPPDKIDAKDFAVLKAEKAKGRGMGLQDESVQPGKVMKAKTGKQIVKEFSASLKGIDESFKSKVHPMKKQRLLDRSTVMTKAKYGKIMKAKRGKFLRSDPTKPISSVQPSTTLPKDFLGKRKALGGVRASLGMLKGPAKAGAILGAALTVPVGKMLKKIQDKRKAKNRDEAKVIKARYGKAIKTELKADPTKPISSVAPKASDILKKKKLPGRIGTALGIASMMVPAAYAAALQYKDYKSAKNRDEAKVKKMGGGMMQGKIYKASEGIMLSAYKRPTMSIQEGAAKARERNKKQDERKKEIDKAAKKYRVGGGGANRYGPHKVDVNRQATEALLGRGPIQEKIIKFADKFNKKIKTKKMVGGMAKKYSVGGGMMQRPMGYKHGTKPGAGPLGAAGLRQPAKENIDQIIKDQKFPPISIYIEDKKKPQKPFPVPSLYNNNKKPSAGRIREDEPRAKKMGEPKGYKSGTMVKARGCKLGRTRPTKMY